MDKVPSQKKKLNRQETINLVVGWILYPLGDFIGQCLLGTPSFERTVVIALMGGIIYRFEVPRWFAFLDKIRASEKRAKAFPFNLFLKQEAEENGKHRLNWLGRTAGAMSYFNPLWIARHVFIIYVTTHHLSIEMESSKVVMHFVGLGLKSFIVNLPISIIGNYIIQERLPLTYRFAGSATLSGIFAISYALEYWFFK